MQPRQNDYFKLAEPGFKHLFALEGALKNGPLEPKLLHLIKLRASQINACVFCIHMHTTEALKDGEDPMRLYLLTGWREATLYTPRERAALAWTEALTNVARTGASDDDWELIEASFTAEERSWLSLAIGAINLWNRLQVGFRATHPA
ncbi:carboxymuconolactone decarboxylase family protein [Pararhizobium sp. BT-229]|uniref:carboxymuconolactone decarboxylase family protein n=1 Tax=Pararhizobium sp. BT-229 TaxID=2986923 RepID=UPI0021F6C461|nr:carboxymuconolactone decarboxylase family protein [Pararhizobium sp. BT-229]MCV9966730.1 carboxymuconolactone decarboxylase family protein [Pararhizobium sp. BT-229]